MIQLEVVSFKWQRTRRAQNPHLNPIPGAWLAINCIYIKKTKIFCTYFPNLLLFRRISGIVDLKKCFTYFPLLKCFRYLLTTFSKNVKLSWPKKHFHVSFMWHFSGFPHLLLYRRMSDSVDLCFRRPGLPSPPFPSSLIYRTGLPFRSSLASLLEMFMQILNFTYYFW